jgi:hypothetical protein
MTGSSLSLQPHRRPFKAHRLPSLGRDGHTLLRRKCDLPPLSHRAPGAAAKTKTKLSQIQQSPAKPAQRKSKKKAWISMDFLVRIKPFQWVAATPCGKKIFSRSFPRPGLWPSPRFIRRPDQGTTNSDFRKGKVKK